MLALYDALYELSSALAKSGSELLLVGKMLCRSVELQLLRSRLFAVAGTRALSIAAAASCELHICCL